MYSLVRDISVLISKPSSKPPLPFLCRPLLLADFNDTSLFPSVYSYFEAVHLRFFRTSDTVFGDFLVVVTLVGVCVLSYNLGTAAVVFGTRHHYQALLFYSTRD